MMKVVGSVLIIIGVIFTLFGAWSVTRIDLFLVEIVFGPIFIYTGLQLLKG